MPHVRQGARPWCYAAVTSMALLYFTAARYAPTMERIVEFCCALEAGAAAQPPPESLVGQYMHWIVFAIRVVGRRGTSAHETLSFEDVWRTLVVDDVLIAALPGHVVVVSGARVRDGTEEVRMNDPAEEGAEWLTWATFEKSVCEWLVVHTRDIR